VKVEIVETTLAHVREICENLREHERVKIGDSPEHIITQEVARSLVCYTGLVDSRPVVMYGARCAGVLDDTALVWLLGSRHIADIPVTFLRHSREALTLLRQHFKSLHGVVLVDFECSVRWLEWLGFSLDAPQDGLMTFHLE
jgi:hypothetical protein